MLISVQTWGQTVVRTMDIQGHRAATGRTLLERFQTRPDRPLNRAELEADIHSLLSWYRDRGYLEARVLPPRLGFNSDSSAVDVLLTLEEGPLIRIGQFEVEGNRYLGRTDVEALMDLRPGQVFRGDLLESDVERLLEVYENEGYPYCRIQVADVHIGERNDLNFRIDIQEGPRIHVHSVEPQGNTITRNGVIRRELGIRNGDLFSQEALERGHRRLRRLAFFREVGEIELLPGEGPDAVVLSVPVQEGRTNRIDGVVGYQPGTDTEDGYFTGLVDLSFRNLMGTGRRVEATWSRRDPLSSRLRFAYQEPWFLGLPLTVGGAIEQINQDSSYAQTDMGFEATTFLGQHLTAGVLFGWGRVIPDARGGEGLPRSRTYSAGLRLELDVRDDLLAPRSGGRYGTTVRHRFKANRATATYQPVQENVESTEFTADLEQYLAPFRRQVVAAGLHLGEIRSDEDVVPLNEQFKLGGARTLRGYREEQFHGSRILWANLEYRLLLGRRSWTFLFLDGGHYFYRSRDPLTDELMDISGEKVGYGLGLRVESRLGILGVDYGLGEGDGLTEGKVHFGVINEF
jgi:outer membrane protein insertion porin family